MDPAALPSGGNFKTLLKGYGLEGFKNYVKYNSFDLLINFLGNPDEKRWQQFIFIGSMMHIDPKRYMDQDSAREWMQDIENLFPVDLADKMMETDCPGFTEGCFYADNLSNHDTNQFLKQYVVIEKKALAPPGNPLGVRVGCYLHDDQKIKTKAEFQSSWNGFLRLYNYYQFLPYSYFVTSEGNKAKAYDTLKIYKEPVAGTHAVEKELPEDDWEELKELTEDYIHPLLDLLKKNKWSLPIAGYELEGKHNEIIACAELAWESTNIAFLTDEEFEYQDKFKANGWKTYTISDVINDPDKYMNLKDVGKK
jgi:hypothetical protein